MSSTYTTSRTYASGTISDNTQQNYNKSTGAFTTSAETNNYKKLVDDNLTYKPSDNVLQAQNAVNNAKQALDDSGYKNQIDYWYNQIVNRPSFNYDVNTDALYNQYKDQYTNLGLQAMQDTSAQAASLTGGYGSSYATTASQQAYQNYLTQLNSMVPELYDRAYNAYQDEGDRMTNLYSMASDNYDRAYGEYRDTVSDYQNEQSLDTSRWQTTLGTATDLYTNSKNFDWSKYAADRDYWTNQWWNEKNASQTTESTSTTVSSGGSGGSGGSSGSSKTSTEGDSDFWKLDTDKNGYAYSEEELYNRIDSMGSVKKSDKNQVITSMLNNGKISASTAFKARNHYGITA